MKTAIRNGYTPKTGDYCEMIVVDKENQNAWIFDCDGVFTPMPQPVDVERILEEAAAYTDEVIEPLKEKLDTIEEGAQENVIEVVQKNGTPLTVTNKTVNVTVPTKTSDLENDSGFIDDLSNYYTKTEVDQEIGTEESARILADNNLQSQIDAITAGSDVVDIVGTKAALDDYDTSGLSANDIIKVLTDETQDDATTYYRWTGSVWQYIGAEGPFYTKSEADSTFVPQTRTINSKALTTNITLTAQDVGALPDSTVIPTVNDATLTIQQNGSTLDTFTANSATNKTIDITVPTKTSDLENDSGFVTEDEIFDEDCVEGENINFEAPAASPLSSFSLKGNTVQSGTPTPSAPVAVQTVTGENVVKICGKNLLQTANIAQATKNGITCSYDSATQVITLDGTCSANNTTFDFAGGNLGLALNGTYTISYESVGGTISPNGNTRIQISTNSWSPIFYRNLTTSASASTTGTVDATIGHCDIRIDSGTVCSNYQFRIQLEESSSATAFEPYQGQSYPISLGSIELCKIGTYQDYIYKSGDDWYLHKETQKIILDGSETWQTWNNKNGYIGFYHYDITLAIVGGEYDYNNMLLCDKLSEVRLRTDIAGGSSEGIKQCGGGGDNQYIAVGVALSRLSDTSTSAAAISSFKTWLSAEKLIVYATLATPTNTQITNQALIEQLEAILAGHTYAGTNNITTVIAAGNAQGELEICYYNTSLPIATTSTPGIVQIGDGIDVDNGTISVDLPTKTSDLTNDGENGTSTYVEAADLATVATSGNYNDLSNKPTIPTVNDATLTIQKNGTNVAAFTANSSTNQTANIAVPVNTSELINDSGFLTSAALSNYYTKSETYTQGEVNSLINSITVPTKTSDLTNDGSDGTSTYVEADELATVATSGDYDDLINKPAAAVDFTGATSSTAGAHGLVPAPSAGDQDKVLKGDGTWGNVGGSGAVVVYPYEYNGAWEFYRNYNPHTDVITAQELYDMFAGGSPIIFEVSKGPGEYATRQIISFYDDEGDLSFRTIDPTGDSPSSGTFLINSGIERFYSISSTEFRVQKIGDVINDDGAGIMTGASASSRGGYGYAPSPSAGDQDKYLKGDGTWDYPVTIDSALDVSSSNPVENSVVTAALNNKADASDLDDYVTLATNQNITGEKTFAGDKRIKFKGSTTGSKMGFTCYSNTNVETGWMESQGTTAAANKKMRLGIWDTNTSATDNDLGFQYRKGNSTYYNLYVAPGYNSPSESTHYIPVGFTDGNTTVEADRTGIVDLSSILPGGGGSYIAGTGIDITNDTISVDNTVAMAADLPSTINSTDWSALWQ